MNVRWYIEVQDTNNWEWVRVHPTLDGIERVFKRRRDAESYAYDYELAGGRNQFTRYVKVLE